MAERFSTQELAKRFPNAFNALPKAYQGDDVLEFWIDETKRDKIRVESRADQEFAIGYCYGFYSEIRQCFVLKDENGNWRNVNSKEE